MQIVPTILPGSYPSKVTQPDGYNPSPLPPPSDYYVSKKEILDNFLKRNPSVPEDTIPTFDSDGQLKSSSKTIEGLINEITAKVTDGATEAYDTLKEIETYINEDKSGTAAIIKDLGNLGSRVTNLEKNGGGGGSSIEVVAPSPDGAGKAADAEAVYDAIKGINDNISDLEAADLAFEDELLTKVNKLINPSNGVVYPSEVNLENGGFYLLGAGESNVCNAYLPVVDAFEPQTFIIYCKNGTSTHFKDRLGRDILTNLDGNVYSGGTINLRVMGFPTQKFKTVTMRKIKDDNGDELIHLEVV